MTKYTLSEQIMFARYKVQKSRTAQNIRRMLNTLRIIRKCEDCGKSEHLVKGHGRMFCDDCVRYQDMPYAVCLDCKKARTLISHSLNGKLGEIIPSGPYCHDCGHCEYVITQ